MRGRRRRYLQMRLARRYLPEEVLRRPKQGFSSGLPYLMGPQFRALFKHFLPDAHLVDAGYLRPEAIGRLLESHFGGQADHGNRLWLLLNAELWHRIRLEEVPVLTLEDEIAGLLRQGRATGEGQPPAPSARASASPIRTY